MDLQRYDIIRAEIKYEGGSVQTKERPYVIVSNPIGTKHGTIITVMPLTSKIKRKDMPVHRCICADSENGLSTYSMALGEQLFTISKQEVKELIGRVTDQKEKKMIDIACFNGLFYGTEYKLEEAKTNVC